MTDTIRRKLIELARSKTTWSYTQLNEQLDLKLNFKYDYDRVTIGDWLEDISVFEFEKKRPLLSALIIHKGTDKEQGDGFYKLCERLYKKPWQDLKADKNFEIEKIKECFSFWKDNENYKKYKDDY
jgi:hypothetical protein